MKKNYLSHDSPRSVQALLAMTVGVVLLLLTACVTAPVATLSPPAAAADLPAPTAIPGTATLSPADLPTGLSPADAADLDTLALVDDYPLYTLYISATPRSAGRAPFAPTGDAAGGRWGCSLFAAFASPQGSLYGRNFDWHYSPAVLLFTAAAPGAYASVSMVDIEYLGYTASTAHGLHQASLQERRPLLDARHLPFDGMNEVGLVVGMAAVSPGSPPPYPTKPTIGSLGIIRQVLDRAATVDEAVDIMASYNVDMEGGPDLHYLIADTQGKAALVEYYQGQMVVIPNQGVYHLATNFLRAGAGDDPSGQCRRYDAISARMRETGGNLSTAGAMSLLSAVSQDITQWSVVYHIADRSVSVVMGRDYEQTYTFTLKP